MTKKFSPETTSFSLHIMAMIFMLLDHLWATLVPGQDWMTCVGRIAYPIFAFMIVEGYFHTHDLKKYVLRLLVCAVVSEIPFNLVMGSSVFYPVHQNVLWTFLIGIAMILLNEKAKGKLWRQILVGIATVFLSFALGIATFCDFNHGGIYIILMFYFLRGNKWWCRLGQFLVLLYIGTEVISGFGYEFTLLGQQMWFTRQNFALLALIPIWLYHGKQGPHGKWVRVLNYGFYPAHLLVLGLLQMLR